MRILVAVGSKYGATREVGRSIAQELRGQGFEVDFEDACDVRSVTYYDAVIVGSAVYGGLWRRDASELVRNGVDALKAREVWLFSVGIGTVVEPGQALDEADGFAALIEAKEHVRFAGRLDFDRLNAGERVLIRALRAPTGDFRDFDEVKVWAQGIGTTLLEKAAL